jgi:hypothetical protein
MLPLLSEKILILILLFLIPVYSQKTSAGEITSVQVKYREGVYALSINAQINAPLHHVYGFLTDYDNLTRISPSVIESRVITQLDDHVHRTTLVTRLCVLFYCRNLRQTQDMVRHPEELLTAMIVPEDSDFKGGFAQWRLKPRDAGTHLLFDAQLKPDFWIPPLAGPFILKLMLTREAVNTVQGLENLNKELHNK